MLDLPGVFPDSHTDRPFPPIGLHMIVPESARNRAACAIAMLMFRREMGVRDEVVVDEDQSELCLG